MTTPPSDASKQESYRPIAPGVELRFVRRHPDRGSSFFIRMEKNARAPRHDHPGGEETCVLSGTLRIDRRLDAEGRPLPDLTLSAGDYAFAAPGETHEGVATEDALFFVVAPAGVTPSAPLAEP